MATLNYAFKEISCKIVYYGCGLCGKTTNLQHIHTTVPGKYRGELVSLATEQDRTLFFDFLPLDLGEVKGFKTKFQLYTVPGQVYYNATRKLVLRGVDGLVFVVDSQRDRLQENLDSLENLKQNLSDYGYSLDEIPWVIQYNKRDMPDVMSVEEMNEAINRAGVPFFESVATTGQGVRETLKGISALVIRNLNQAGVTAGAATTAGASALPKPVAAGVGASADRSDGHGPAGGSSMAAGIDSEPPAASPESSPPARAGTPVPRVRLETVKGQEKEAAAATAGGTNNKPKLTIRQKCDVRWRGIRLGTAQLQVSNRNGEDGRGDYQLAGVITFAGVIRQSWARLLRFKLREVREYAGTKTPFFRMESAPGEEGAVLTVWVKDSYDPQLFMYFTLKTGAVTVHPSGVKSAP